MSNELPFINKLIDSLTEIGEIRTIPKDDFLIKEGEIEKNLYWV